MSDFRVSSRYARSLLELAIEQGKEKVVASDMQLFAEVCRQNRDFRLVLKNPIIRHDKKLKILDQIFKGKVDPLTLSIFKLIAHKNREAILPLVAEEFHRQYNEKRGIVEASVTTTFQLDDELLARFSSIVEKISGKQPVLKPTVDPELVGGFVLRIEDKQIDESIKSKLQDLALRFKNNEGIRGLIKD